VRGYIEFMKRCRQTGLRLLALATSN